MMTTRGHLRPETSYSLFCQGMRVYNRSILFRRTLTPRAKALMYDSYAELTRLGTADSKEYAAALLRLTLPYVSADEYLAWRDIEAGVPSEPVN